MQERRNLDEQGHRGIVVQMGQTRGYGQVDSEERASEGQKHAAVERKINWLC